MTSIHSSTGGHLDGALIWHDAGMSVIPGLADGTKKPFGLWKRYQTERASRAQVEQWFKTAPKSSVILICGKVSGGLELCELEGRAADSESLDRIEAALRAQGAASALEFWNLLLESGYCEATPSGGLHFLYRITDHDVPGNTKIANRPPTAEELEASPKLRSVTLSETRGEGGYVIVAPSSGTVHPTGGSWSVLTGTLGVVPQIDWKTRCALHQAIADALDEMPEVPVFTPRPMTSVSRPAGDLLPGEDFCARTSWDHLLSEYGWQYHSANVAGGDLWTRPGKRVIDGHSASVGTNGSDNLYVWSSAADLPIQQPLSKFAFYAHMEHRGDFSAAGKALYALGYGTRASAGGTDVSDWFDELPVAKASVDTSGVQRPERSGPVKVSARISQFTEKGVARFATETYGHRLRYVHEERGWRIYSDGVWTGDSRRDIGKIAERVSDAVDRQVGEFADKAQDAFDSGQPNGKELLDEARKLRAFAKSMASDRGMKAITSIMANHVGTSMSEFDVDSHLICFDNGTLDLRTREFRDHRETDMLTKRIPVVYDPAAQAPRWREAIRQWLPNESVASYVQRGVGMGMKGDTSEAAFFVLHGPTGCGKSTFLEVIGAAMGDYAGTAAAKTFRTSRSGDDGPTNDLHDLMGKRFVSTSETSEGTSLNEELIKRVTGGDKVTSRAMYQSNITWKPQFTMWMATNHLPRMNSDDNAIWRRVKPVEFPNSFYVEGSKPQKGLAAAIIAEELPGVINWILEGLWAYEQHGLDEPEKITKAVKEYRDDTDQVRQFVSQSVDEGSLLVEPDAEIDSKTLYQVYHAWTRDNGIKALGPSRFGNRLTAMGFDTVRTASVRKRSGIKLNPAYGAVAAQRAASDSWWR